MKALTAWFSPEEAKLLSTAYRYFTPDVVFNMHAEIPTYGSLHRNIHMSH